LIVLDNLRTAAKISICRRTRTGKMLILKAIVFPQPLTVLDAQRNLFNAQLYYAQLQAQALQALVNVYQATGGGWVNKAEQLTATAVPAAAMAPFR
jgi:hypothetical protein